MSFMEQNVSLWPLGGSEPLNGERVASRFPRSPHADSEGGVASYQILGATARQLASYQISRGNPPPPTGASAGVSATLQVHSDFHNISTNNYFNVIIISTSKLCNDMKIGRVEKL